MHPASHNSFISLSVYLEPPGGLTNEWQNVFRTLADPVRIVHAFFAYHKAPFCPVDSAPPPNICSLRSWRDQLRAGKAAADKIARDLHGRAPGSWKAWHAIDNAIHPILSHLQSVIYFERLGSPSHLHSRIALKEMSLFDGRSLLEELAEAVTRDADKNEGKAQGHPANAGKPTEHKETNTKASASSGKLPRPPRNPLIQKLISALNNPKNRGKEKLEIARGITEDDERKAKSICSALRRYERKLETYNAANKRTSSEHA